MKDNYFDEINDSELELFIARTKSKIWIDSSEEEVLIDYTWVSKVEECIPYLDNIIRNPRKFLIQEEEVVPVEKARRTTPETVRHLAQNTNLIQNIDEDGMLQPSKVLNINKEDTVDIYENRFIYTLLINLNDFVRRQLDAIGENGSYYKCDKKASFEGETKLKNDKVKISLSLENNHYHELPIVEDGEKTIKERLEDIRIVVAGFMVSQFIKSLRQVSLVKSPIRKTNIILKEQNFKKALELWEYIESCQISTPKITKNTDSILENEIVKERFNFGYFIDYNSLDFLNPDKVNKNKKLYNVAFIKRIIDEYLNEVGGSEKTFVKMLREQFKIVYKQRKRRETEVKKLYSKFLKEEENNFKKCELLLK